MGFLDDIVDFLNDASDLFYDIYREVLDWVYPFWLAADFFYEICLLFNDLAYAFRDFGDLIWDWRYEIEDILSWSTIRSYIRNWLPDLENMVVWFWDWYDWIINTVENWWYSTKYTVQAWIDSAQAFLQSQINSIDTYLAYLEAAWDSFKGMIPDLEAVTSWFANWWNNALANIIAWGALTGTQIQGLVDSAFTLRDDFWAGWQDWRDKVAEFFTDPEDWLYKAVDRIVERFW